MKKYLLMGTLAMASMFTQAGTSQVSGAKIQIIEFYGNQFTITLDKPHTSKGCGHPGNNVVAIDTSKEPGATHYSALLAIWVADKSVAMRITDDLCSGDRPTLLNWSAH